MLVGFMVAFNEADFIEYSIRSVIESLDELIIIEGSWAEHYQVNGELRSDDGTIEIIKKLQKEFSNISLYHKNENSQLEQRNLYFKLCPKNPHVMLLVDADEVWKEDDLQQIKQIADKWPTSGALPPHVYTVNSLVFINDFYTMSPVRYPRIWELEPGLNYRFTEPNTILINNEEFYQKDLDLSYFHYSYTHSPERFRQKKRERTKLHGNFAWELRNGLVQRDDANIQQFNEKHPKIMREHPLFGVKKHAKIEKQKCIVYVEHSGIGNLVLATPMLQALRQANPNAHIHVVTWKRSSRILEGTPYIDSVIDEPKQLAQLNEIDTLLIPPLTVLPDVEKFLINKSKKTIRVDAIQPWTQHEAERKMVLAKKMGYRGPTPHPSIPIFDYNIENVKNYSPDIIINASCLKESPWHLKHWGNHNYAELITRLSSEYPDYTYAFVGTSYDYEDAAQIINAYETPTKEHFINLCGFSDDIKDTAALINKSPILIGNDGGLSHIASALDIPTVTIFTFTNPIKNKPLGKKAKIVMKPCKERLYCQHGRWQNCEQNGCLNVPVKDVIKVVRGELSKVLFAK